ncbi:MAG: GGDEF domain-containing protein [Oscillospiraceae bacterium]|nr:GGDEF domain-containing protein [Oscillospiraceae bacterium]
MENKRHCIAVILSEICEVYQTMLIDGIKKRAAEAGYNVAVFASFFSHRQDSPLNEIGESHIFSLINYTLFDGFIVVPNALEAPGILDEISKNLKLTGKPVVYIDRESDEFYSVCSDDYSSFKLITNHLIHHHGFTKINCITGYPGLNLSELRLQGYKDALKENGIEIEEERYTYGDFWRVAPVEFVEHILTCGLELPQAVVCANDTMAIATCEALKERGIRVPEDIAVTGFDRILDGKVARPKVSSLEPSMSKIGTEAVELIINVLDGKPVEKAYYIPGTFYPSESCGCISQTHEQDRAADIDVVFKSKELGQYFVNSIYMSEHLQESKDVDDLFARLAQYIFLLNDIKTLHIFLNDNWDILQDRNSAASKPMPIYSETVNTKFFFDLNEKMEDFYSFPSELMFPPLFYNSLSPETYFILPLNFQNKTFGYSVCSCQGETITPDAIFRNWIKYLSNTLEYLSSKQHLEWALKRLERMSEMDSLTGVYNRNGYENKVHHVFDRAKEESKDFLIIMGDLDCLKMINDNFGHAEGDNAIRIIAKALQNSFTEDEACARIGGDEFIMFGTGNFDEEKLKSYPTRIQEYLDHYNNNSSKPYLIGMSLGIYCQKVSQDSKLEEWIEKADENMYANKKGKVKVYLKEHK